MYALLPLAILCSPVTTFARHQRFSHPIRPLLQATAALASSTDAQLLLLTTDRPELVYHLLCSVSLLRHAQSANSVLLKSTHAVMLTQQIPLCSVSKPSYVCCRSQYQLTYQQAQDMLYGRDPTTGPRDMPVNPKDHAELQSRLRIFKQLTDKLRAARIEANYVWNHHSQKLHTFANTGLQAARSFLSCQLSPSGSKPASSLL